MIFHVNVYQRVLSIYPWIIAYPSIIYPSIKLYFHLCIYPYLYIYIVITCVFYHPQLTGINLGVLDVSYMILYISITVLNCNGVWSSWFTVYPIYSMALEYLPTFALKITQSCRFLYTSTMGCIWDMSLAYNPWTEENMTWITALFAQSYFSGLGSMWKIQGEMATCHVSSRASEARLISQLMDVKNLMNFWWYKFFLFF